MKAVAITNEGFEDICEDEIKYLGCKKTLVGRTVVFFEGSKQDLVRIVYKSQSTKRILLFLKELNFSGVEDLGKVRLDLKEIVQKDDTFAIRCEKYQSKVSSQEIENAIGKNILLKVDLKNPDIIVFAYVVENHCYLGVDISGIDLSKRYYKIFAHPNSIKGTLAYFLLKRAGYDGKQALLDPMAGSGTIPIEAAHILSEKSVNFYRKNELTFTKMKFFSGTDLCKEDNKIISAPKKVKISAYDNQLSCINAIRKNAKIAGINKFISYGRGEVDWIDTKFGRNSIDMMVANPPSWSKFNQKQNRKLYKQLFFRSKPILKKDGRITILTNSAEVKKIAKDNGYKLKNEWNFNIGDRLHFILKLLK